MAKLNRKSISTHRTHEGAPAKHINYEMQLRRSVMSCMLWENNMYEDGIAIANRIHNAVSSVDPEVVSNMAEEARKEMNLRHVPLLMVNAMLDSKMHRKFVAETLYNIVNRPDELAEMLAMYFVDGKKPLANQLKKGLAKAFTKFNAYQLAKWDKPADIRLRDVMFMVHPKPINEEQEKVFKQLADNTLPSPDTWEVALSSGGDKREHWTRLLKEKKLGAMALLRNLRNMVSAGVNDDLIRNYMRTVNTSMVLPFRFIAAARYASRFEDSLEEMLMKNIASHAKFKGKTVLLIDVSGSMDWSLSTRSDMNRIDAACGLAIILRELCEDIRIYTFSQKIVRIAPRRGFALAEAINRSQDHSSTYLGASVKAIYGSKDNKISAKSSYGNYSKDFTGQGEKPDRLIVVTDEQSHDSVPDPNGLGYMINVASNANGVGYGSWIHVDGFSESIIKWLQAYETEFVNKH